MNGWIVGGIITGIALLVMLIAYERWATPGINALRHHFEDKNIDSIYSVVKVLPTGKVNYRLVFRRKDGAELMYYHRTCKKPYALTDDIEWERDLATSLNGYTAWQIEYFARRLAKEQGAVFKETTVDSQGADGWSLTFS